LDGSLTVCDKISISTANHSARVHGQNHNFSARFQKEIAMKRLVSLIASAVLLASAGAAVAQPRHDDHSPPGHDDHSQMQMHPGMSMTMRGPHHPDWKKGGHIGRGDWGRGSRIDYRTHHLKAPPRGYEWREVDGDYVLAAVATGLIASVILASH
jgi:Ni/Co efflux regulator RcnB